MKPGVYAAKKKDQAPYFRASLTYKRKHISLGSYLSEHDAAEAYKEGTSILSDKKITIEDFSSKIHTLLPEKTVSLINLRDNGTYIKTPIYLRQGYFSYFINGTHELKFSNDDLFYYSMHRILVHDGHYYVNDYGMQYAILDRFGIRPYAVKGRDFLFSNGDETDLRYENIIVINRFHGVRRTETNGVIRYEVRIKINGEFLIGRFRTEEKAAIAYNKAADEAVKAGVKKKFPQNYITELSAKEYADIYTDISMPKKYLDYLDSFTHSFKSL